MKKYVWIAVVLSSGLLYQNCGSGFKSMGELGAQSSSSVDLDFTVTADPALQQSSLQILSVKCATCHQDIASGNVGQILDVKYNISTGLLTPGDPTKGRLIGSIEDNSMPTGAVKVTAAELQTLKSWISSIRVTGVQPPPPAPVLNLPAGKTVNSDPVLYTQAFKIVNINCAGCHNSAALGGIAEILKVDQLVSTGLVKPGDPTKGRLIGSIEDGTMPKGAASVSAADLLILKNWITSMQIVDISPSNPAKITLPILAPTFTSISKNILEPKCVGCHGPVRADDGKRYDTYANASSRLNASANSGIPNSMPQAPYPKLTTAERAAISDWVKNGKLND